MASLGPVFVSDFSARLPASKMFLLLAIQAAGCGAGLRKEEKKGSFASPRFEILEVGYHVPP